MLTRHHNKIKLLHSRLPTRPEKRRENGAGKENEEPYPISAFNLI